jgi:SNF2 family DNA or RNA helicase
MKKKFGERYAREAWTDSASKYEAFKSWAESAEKKPTIVFTTFRTEGDLAETALRRAGYKVWNVRGGMTESHRDKVRAESAAAHAAGEHVAIVIQIVVGSAGLNLQHCNRVVFLSSHWNPTIVDQAIARAYRIGQTADVEVHHFLMADGAERNIDRIMAHKHGAKRLVALTVHEKLFCDSAADTSAIMSVLDSVCPPEYDVDAADEKAEVAAL